MSLFSVCVYPAMALHLSGAAALGWGYRWRGSVWAAWLTARAGATGRTTTANTGGNSSLRETEGGATLRDTFALHSVVSYRVFHSTYVHTNLFLGGRLCWGAFPQLSSLCCPSLLSALRSDSLIHHKSFCPRSKFTHWVSQRQRSSVGVYLCVCVSSLTVIYKTNKPLAFNTNYQMNQTDF